MRELLLRNLRYFVLLAIAGLAFRLYFVLVIPAMAGDSYVYADIAKNLLQHHLYGITGTNGPHSTIIRLPGYPFFLAAVFHFFGTENWRAVGLIQAVLDTITCFLIAAIARRIISDRAAKIACALAVFCPFTANYAGVPLTETLTLFLTSLALLLTVQGFDEKRLGPWLWCGVTLAFAILLRPDAGWLLGAIGLAMLIRLWTIPGERPMLLRGGVLVLVISLAPLVPWTIRNWQRFHVFQPLVTPHATEIGEWEARGWMRWLNTWVIEYSSMEDVAFKMEEAPIEITDIPKHAFADEQERQQVAALLETYNETTTLTPQLDAEFGRIADEHIRRHPVQYYFTIPFLRLTDMWLRARTEMLPFDTHWWRFDEDVHDASWSVGLMVLNFGYIAIGIMGIFRGGPMRYIGVFILYLAIRSLFLMYMGAIEQRYTLEGYPCLIVLGSRYLDFVVEKRKARKLWGATVAAAL